MLAATSNSCQGLFYVIAGHISAEQTQPVILHFMIAQLSLLHVAYNTCIVYLVITYWNANLREISHCGRSRVATEGK